MATSGLTLTGLTTPIDVFSAETATFNLTLDSFDTVNVSVFAVPVGGGPEVNVGTSVNYAGAGTYSGETINLTNLDQLNPGQTYNFVIRSSDGFNGGGTISGEVVTCFTADTMIATEQGQVAVQDLRVGDLVLTIHQGAALRPIAWIGHTRIDLVAHPARAKAAPILIRAGALADGVPHRDLRVSPEHAMFIDGILVPAHLLVNGSTIVQEMWRTEVTYWHVELEGHGLLVSEGAVSESYFDDGNRQSFDNHAITALVKDFASHRGNGRYREAACAPLIDVAGAEFARITIRLAERAARYEDAVRRVA